MKKIALAFVCCTALMVLAAPIALAQQTSLIDIGPGGFMASNVCLSSDVTAGCQVATNNDATTTTGGALRLTSNTANQSGSAWFVTPEPVASGFTATFQFLITNPSATPADGLAFVIQNASAALGAIGYTGGNGGAIAYGDDDTNSHPNSGIPSSLAIEFDTFQNGWDADANHVAVQSCGKLNNTSHHKQLCSAGGSNSTLGIAPAATLGSDILSASGQLHTVSVLYIPPAASCAPTCNNLTVTLDGTIILTVSADLTSLGLSDGNAYVGFTGATGAYDEDQDIVSWSMTQGQSITPTSGLTQELVLDSTTDNLIYFGFDYSVANADSDPLTIQPGTFPFVNLEGISQANWTTMTNGTSLGGGSCLLAAGLTDASGNRTLCAITTMVCTTTAVPIASGANCPQSTVRNILFNQETDLVYPQAGNGSGFPGIDSTGDLAIPANTAFGIIELPDAITTGAQCSYPSGSPLAGQLCPQNIITQLEDNTPHSGGTGTTANSSYVLFCCEPEWQTTLTIPMWSNTASVPVTATSEPPGTPPEPSNPTGFQAAQVTSVVVGAELQTLDPLDPTFPIPGEQPLSGTPSSCPTSWSTQNPTTFSGAGTITDFYNGTGTPTLAEGAYNAHFFSVDCANFEELVYPGSISVKPGTPGATNLLTFKTVSFNIDMTAPNLTLPATEPSGSYGSMLTSSITCTDPVSGGVASGIATCGPGPGYAGQNPVIVTVTLPTNVLGSQTYNVTATDQAGNSTTTSFPYNVTTAMLSITAIASGTSMTYGGTPPTITASYSGFAIGDNAGSLTTQPTCSTAATSSSPVGNYSTSCMGAVDANYMISYVAGPNVTVNPAPLTITPVTSSSSMTYGGTPPTITASYKGFVNGQTASNLTTQPTCSTTATKTSSVGSYSTTCMGAVDANYMITYATGPTVTVNPAPLTIKASSATVAYGSTIPPITASYSGFVNSQTASSLTTQPTCSTTAISTSPGMYPSSCTGAVDPNYAIGYVNGTITVSAPPSLMISPATWPFGTLYLGQSASQTFTLTAGAGSSVAISSVTIPGSNSDSGTQPPGDPDDFKITNNNCVKTLSAGTSCTVKVTFTSDSDDPNEPHYAYLTVTDNAAGSPQTAYMYGTVINPKVSLSATSYGFGKQTSGSSITEEVAKLTNSGTTTLTLGTLSVSGSTFTPGSGSGTNCSNGGSVAPGSSCAIYVTFTPTKKGTKYSGTVTITDNAQNSPQSISLSGTGN